MVASVEELEALRTSPLGQVLGQGGQGAGRMGGEGGGGFSNSFGGPGGVDPERLRFPPSPLSVPATPWEMSRMYFFFGTPLTPDEIDVSTASSQKSAHSRSLLPF